MRIEVEVRGQRQEIKNAVYSAQQSENCLECAFDFITPEWQGLVKTAHFRAEPDGEVFCAVLQEDQCLVPSKVLEKDGYFSFSVIGEKENYRITTAALSVLNRKAVYGGEPQEEPEETQYEQMISLAASAVSTAKQAQETANAVKADAESGKFKGEKGDPGEKGDTGPQGVPGPQGEFAEAEDHLDAESTAPVQNKVITRALSGKQDQIPAALFLSVRYNDWVMGAMNAAGVFIDSTTRIRSGYHYYETGTQIMLKPPANYWLAAITYSKDGETYVKQTATGWVSDPTLVTIENGVNYVAFQYGQVNNAALTPADGVCAELLIKLPGAARMA